MGKKTASAEKDEFLNRFLKKLEQIKEQIRKFSVFLETINFSNGISELKLRLEKVEPLLSSFEETVLEIQLLDESRFNEDANYEFEELYYRSVTLARGHVEKYEFEHREVLTNNSSQGMQQSHSVGVKLPSIGLQKFAGDYSKFQQFYETFQTLVHNNVTLDNVQRFYYLLDSLEGEAKRVLECLEVTSSNYAVAIDLLKKRFFNKPIIIQTHLKELFDIAPLSRESHNLLQGLVDNIEKHVRALKTLGEPIEQWGRLIIFFLSRKLDLDSKKEWEERSLSEYKGDPNLGNFIEFLGNKARILSTVECNNKSVRAPNKNVGNRAFAAVDNSLEKFNAKIKCEVCKGDHFVYTCKKLLELDIDRRSEQIKSLGLCFNCLRSSHQVRNCKSYGCKKCRGRHNTILHQDSRNTGNSVACTGTQDIDNGKQVAATCSSNVRTKQISSQIVLSTAVIEIRNCRNEFIQCRALLDSGSQVNFITEEFAAKLGLKVQKICMPISGIGDKSFNVKDQIKSTIKSVHNNFTANIPFLVLKNVTSNIPSSSFSMVDLDIPTNIKLADPGFNKSSRVDVLLGAGVFFELLCAGQIKLGKEKPVLQKTVLGWIVSGAMQVGSENVNRTNNRVMSHHVVQDVQEQLEKFWLVEEFPISKPSHSREEEECEEHFVKTTTRDETGRFCVNLPTKSNLNELGESLDMAKNRMYSLEKKFAKNPTLKQRYCQFIDEYSSLGHMSKINEDEIVSDSKTFYLPHHAVFNEFSTTTKLRVVFDASAKSSSSLSLNSVLKVGPSIQDELFNILVRFRQNEVVVTADITKMYRQVNISPEQRDLQRIVWRSSPDRDLEHFRLNTVTYGTASAAFLATRCLQEVSNKLKDRLPQVSKVISKCFYVDDLIVGASSVSQAVELGREVAHNLKEYGFSLCKWGSNKVEVLKAFPNDNNYPSNYFIPESDMKKTLGLFWNPNQDTLEYTIRSKSSRTLVTKRLILSIISQIFDPLGLVGPITVQAKIILQRLWHLQLGWDESIPLDLLTLWRNLYSELELLDSVRIARHCVVCEPVCIEMHGFCDASESAYGACVYLRSLNKQGEIVVNLVCAKSRVAPLKYTSIPRLELCGALLLARLVHKVVGALDITIGKSYFWTDSTIVLAWLREESSNWKVYVANRIAEIQELSSVKEWNHVVSNDNPADIISRGMNPSMLRESNLWWHGPSWLCQDRKYWPIGDTNNSEEIPERKKEKISLISIVPDKSIFVLKSSLFQLVKIVAWCLRFYRNLNLKLCDREVSKCLTAEETENALISLAKVAQEEEFAEDLRSLKKHGHVLRNSKLKSLDPFYENGLILVGGRLQRSDMLYSIKHPIILPQKHQLTRLIILDQHKKQLHAGPQAILASLRNRFWIINGRKEVRSVLSKCHICFRVNPTVLRQKMGNLPSDRITPQRPFYVCGVDFAGPFNLKDGKLRNRAIVKAYMCLFICFSTKAVHIELAGDLSTDSFLNCFKRFVSRRGICRRIYSDNGTNFVGANNELIKINKELSRIQGEHAVREYCLENKIDWHFIPPGSPHQGGIWESAIKSAKYHVIRLTRNRNFTFEDLSTILSQVEAVLNSRPLTPLSSDPNDLQALTPGHFLIGEALIAIPQLDVSDVSTNRLKQYHLMQQVVQHMWKRLSVEYLTTLQKRNKWQQTSPNLEVGEMVVLKDENTSPLQWKLGRVVAVHPGQDGAIRVASVKTLSGVVRRTIHKLCVLPNPEQIETDMGFKKGEV